MMSPDLFIPSHAYIPVLAISSDLKSRAPFLPRVLSQ